MRNHHIIRLLAQVEDLLLAPELPPISIEEAALLGVGPAWDWGRFFRHTLLRHEDRVRLGSAEVKRPWVAAERLRRRIRRLPAAAQAA